MVTSGVEIDSQEITTGPTIDNSASEFDQATFIDFGFNEETDLQIIIPCSNPNSPPN